MLPPYKTYKTKYSVLLNSNIVQRMVVKSQTLLIVVIILLLDVYIFQVVKSLTAGAINNVRFIAHGAYWVISSLTLLCVCL